MKEHAIIFSPEMVKSTLADRKTMTRRIVGLDLINEDPNDWQFEWFDYKVGYAFTQKSTINANTLSNGSFNQAFIKCPYGNAADNDLLFVRENWRPYLRGDGADGFKRLIQFTADGYELQVPNSNIEWFERVEGMGYKQRPSNTPSKIWFSNLVASGER